jgi:hypothetical protein
MKRFKSPWTVFNHKTQKDFFNRHEYLQHDEQGSLFACKIIAAKTTKQLATLDNLMLVYPALSNAKRVGVAKVIKASEAITSNLSELSQLKPY